MIPSCSTLKQQYLTGDWQRDAEQHCVDLKTQEVYNRDSPNTIRGKCALVFLGNIFRSSALLLFHLGRLIYHLFKNSVLSIHHRMRKSKTDHTYKPIHRGCCHMFRKQLWEDLCALGRDITMGFGVQCGSFYGLFSPYNGRKIVGKCERFWNQGRTIQQGGFYLASCFQGRPITFYENHNRTIQLPLKHSIHAII